MRPEIDAMVRHIHANLARSSGPATQLESGLAKLSLDGIGMAHAAREALVRIVAQSSADDHLYAREQLAALPRF